MSERLSFTRHVALKETSHAAVCRRSSRRVEAVVEALATVSAWHVWRPPRTGRPSVLTSAPRRPRRQLTPAWPRRAGRIWTRRSTGRARRWRRAARAEIHEGEVQALQRLDRATLKAALNGCYEEYRAAVEQCDANDRYACSSYPSGARRLTLYERAEPPGPEGPADGAPDRGGLGQSAPART